MCWYRLALPILFILSALTPGLARGETLTIGVEDEPYYPIYQPEGDNYTGAGPEILNTFAKAAGHTIVYQRYPVSRLYRSLITGEVDYKFPDNQKWAQETKAGVTVVYSDPIITYIDGSNMIPARQRDDLVNLHILGLPLGFTPWEYKDLIAQKKVSVAENPSFDGLIQQALAGRIDAIYASVSVVAYHVKQLHLPGALVFNAHLPYTKDSYRLSSIKHPEVIAQFNKWLSENAGTVAEIKTRYGAEDGF